MNLHHLHLVGQYYDIKTITLNIPAWTLTATSNRIDHELEEPLAGSSSGGLPT